MITFETSFTSSPLPTTGGPDLLEVLRALPGFEALSLRWEWDSAAERPVRQLVSLRTAEREDLAVEAFLAATSPARWEAVQGKSRGWDHPVELLRREQLLVFEKAAVEAPVWADLGSEGEFQLNWNTVHQGVLYWPEPWTHPTQDPKAFSEACLKTGRRLALEVRLWPVTLDENELAIEQFAPLGVSPLANRRPVGRRPIGDTAVGTAFHEQALQQIRLWKGRAWMVRPVVFSDQPVSPALARWMAGFLTSGESGIEVGDPGPQHRQRCLDAWNAWETTPWFTSNCPPGRGRMRYASGLSQTADLLRWVQPTISLNHEIGHRLWGMSTDDRLRHTYIVGQTGTGKSTLLLNHIVHDLRQGYGVGLIDPHGDLVEAVLDRIGDRAHDVVLIRPGHDRPVGINVLEARTPLEQDFTVNSLIDIFYSLWDEESVGGPMFEMYMRNTLYAVMGSSPRGPRTLADAVHFLESRRFREQVLQTCPHLAVRSFWKEQAEAAGGDAELKNIVPYITSKLNRFLCNHSLSPMFVQPVSTIDFSAVLDQKKVLLVDLKKSVLGDQSARFLAQVILGRMLSAALGRRSSERGQLAPFFLYADEFQNVANATVVSMLSETRKYGLGLVLAHQYAGQLKEPVLRAVLGNVGTLAAFRTARDEATEWERRLGVPAADLAALPNYQVAVRALVDGTPVPPQVLTTARAPEATSAIHRELAEDFSRMQYGTDPKAPEPEQLLSEDSDLEAELSRLFGEQ